ncbi:MAG: hypothetical protein ABEL76_17040 [Bradymonadaceae bacterium]
MRTGPFDFLLPIALAAGLCAVGCNSTPEDPERSGPGWRLDSGENTPDVEGGEPDAHRPDCPRGSARCPPPDAAPPDDVETPDAGQRADTDPPGIADAGRADSTRRDTPPPSPRAGRSFNGPKVEGEEGSVPNEVGVGLFWQSIHQEANRDAIHRYVPNLPVATLAKIDPPSSGSGRWSWRLPKSLPERRHYYAAYCDRVGEGTCEKEGIDDDTAYFAVAKLGLLRAPRGNKKPSDCTFGMIRGKIRCRYGRVVQSSGRALAIYVYRSFDPADFPVFEDWRWQFPGGRKLNRGWYIALLHPQKSVNLMRPRNSGPVEFEGRFPMLFK